MSDTYVVRLTETQMKAFEAFIGRVNLNAKEVEVFNNLILAFQKADVLQAEEEAPSPEKA